MTDIKDELRGPAMRDNANLGSRAADEIERLEKSVWVMGERCRDKGKAVIEDIRAWANKGDRSGMLVGEAMDAYEKDKNNGNS